MPPTNAASRVLAQAADCGLHITGLDGWTQTRLAEALSIRRETLNAIINRSPGAEPTPQRPRMVEACRRLITFAAALSAKEDAVLKLPIDVANLQSDDGQAYEHHRLRLHKLAETAAADSRYTDALCRIGEFASAAMHAAPLYRLRMMCNVVTAIQRLLDKPESRQIPQQVLKANLGRLYRAERCAREIRRAKPSDAPSREQTDYVRGQVGYALIFTGIILPDTRLVTRGGRRLFAAVEAQPDTSYGHWSNLLRAIDDLLAMDEAQALDWTQRATALAARQGGRAFSEARDTLASKGEIQRLIARWNHSPQPAIAPPRRRTAKLAAWAIGLMLATLGASSLRAGDGRDFKTADTQQPTPVTPSPVPVPGRPRPGLLMPNTDPDRKPVRVQQGHGIQSLSRAARDIPADADVPHFVFRNILTSADVMNRSSIVQGNWGDRIREIVEAAPRPIISPPPPAPVITPPAIIHEETRALPAPKAPVELPPRPTVSMAPADRAERALSMARNYLAAEKFDTAREKLQQIIKTYPDTPAAAEADRLLHQVASN